MLPAPSYKVKYHKTLAAYFNKYRFGRRKVRELPWQLLASEEMEHLFKLYSDLSFFHLAWRTDRFETKEFWTEIEKNSDYKITSAYQSILINASDEQISYYEDIIDLLFETYHIKEAIPLLEFQVQYYRRQNYPFHLLRSIAQYAFALKETGLLGPAMTWYQELEKLAREGGHQREYCTALGNQASILILQSKLDFSMNLLNQQEKLSKALNDRYNLFVCLNNKSLVNRYRGEATTAQELLTEGEAIAKDIDKELFTVCEFNQGVLLNDMGRDEEARLIFDSSLEKFTRVGDKKGIALTYGNLAVISIGKGDYSGAKELLDRQEDICTKHNDQVMLQACLCNKALLFIYQHQFDTAHEFLFKAEKNARKFAMPEGICKSFIYQAFLAIRMTGHTGKANILLNEARVIAADQGLALPEKEINALSNADQTQSTSTCNVEGWMLPIVMMSHLSFTRKPVAVQVDSEIVIPDWSLMNEEEIMSYIKNGGNPIMTDKDGGTALMAAALLRSSKLIEYLLNLQSDVNGQDIDGTSALMIAANKGDMEVMQLLIEGGADINHQKADGFTPLLFAVQSGNNESVILLLKTGADPNRSTVLGLTPIHLATFHCNTVIASELLRYGADPLKKTADGLTAIDIAEQKCPELLSLLNNTTK